MSYMDQTLFDLSPGTRVSGIPDFPLSIYRIVAMHNVGKGIDLDWDYIGGNNSVILINEKTGRLRAVDRATPFTLLDPADQWKQSKNIDDAIHHKLENKTREHAKLMKNHFDTETLKDQALSTAKYTKDIVVRMKAGKAILTTIKSSIRETPGLPPQLLVVLDTPYADAIIGVVLGALVPVITDNKIACKAAATANFAGTIELAEKFTFIEDWIEKGVAFIPAKIIESLGEVEDTLDDE